MRYVPVRPRPPVTLLRHYRNPWKAAYHHFQRYSDIRVKGRLPPHPRPTFVRVVQPMRTDESGLVCSAFHRGEEGHATGHGQSERGGLQSTRLENSPVCRTAPAAGECRPSTSQHKLLFIVVVLYFNGLGHSRAGAEKPVRFHL